MALSFAASVSIGLAALARSTASWAAAERPPDPDPESDPDPEAGPAGELASRGGAAKPEGPKGPAELASRGLASRELASRGLAELPCGLNVGASGLKFGLAAVPPCAALLPARLWPAGFLIGVCSRVAVCSLAAIWSAATVASSNRPGSSTTASKERQFQARAKGRI